MSDVSQREYEQAVSDMEQALKELSAEEKKNRQLTVKLALRNDVLRAARDKLKDAKDEVYQDHLMTDAEYNSIQASYDAVIAQIDALLPKE